MRQSLRLGSISGIPVGINWGLLAIALLYLINLAVGILPASVPGASTLSYWLFAGFGVTAFFASVLAHELGHSLVAQRNNIRVKAITLWLLGGVAELEKEADDPGVEFRIAIAGPAVSVVLAVIFGALAWSISTFLGGGVFAFTLGYLAFVNGALAIFNMIPAAPLDGGRVLTAALWSRSNNRHTARARAARAGELFGTLLIVVGVLGIIYGAGTFIMAILGFFLRTAATAERMRAETFHAMTKTDLRTAMLPIVPPITAGVTLAGVEAMGASYDRAVAFPVNVNGTVIGLVSSEAVASTPITERNLRPVEAMAVSWSAFTSASINEPLTAVVERAQLEGKEHVLVYDELGRQRGYLPLDGSVLVAT